MSTVSPSVLARTLIPSGHLFSAAGCFRAGRRPSAQTSPRNSRSTAAPAAAQHCTVPPRTGSASPGWGTSTRLCKPGCGSGTPCNLGGSCTDCLYTTTPCSHRTVPYKAKRVATNNDLESCPTKHKKECKRECKTEQCNRTTRGGQLQMLQQGHISLFVVLGIPLGVASPAGTTVKASKASIRASIRASRVKGFGDTEPLRLLSWQGSSWSGFHSRVILLFAEKVILGPKLSPRSNQIESASLVRSVARPTSAQGDRDRDHPCGVHGGCMGCHGDCSAHAHVATHDHVESKLVAGWHRRPSNTLP